MAGWNNGTFTGLYNWESDQRNGIKIRADRHTEQDSTFITGINTCITKDGSNNATADLPMATYKHTSVANAAARNQYLALGQFQDASSVYYATTGSSNAYVVTTNPQVTSYIEGLRFYIKSSFTNTGAATINISGLGVKALTKEGVTALVAGDIVGDTIYQIQYDGTQFQVLNTLAIPDLTPSFTSVNVSSSTTTSTLDATTSLTTPLIVDVNGNEVFNITSTASAVNEFTVTNSATGDAVGLSATGDDTDIDLSIQPKGTGQVIIKGLTLPAGDGTAGQILKTDGSGALGFADKGDTLGETLSANLLGAGRVNNTQYTNATGNPLMVYFRTTNSANGFSDVSIGGVVAATFGGFGNSSGGFFIVPVGLTYKINSQGVTLNHWYEV